VEAIAGAKILQSWLPSSPLQSDRPDVRHDPASISCRHVPYAEFEFWFSSIKVAALWCSLPSPASYALAGPHRNGATFGNLVDYGGFTPHGWIGRAGCRPTVFSPCGAENCHDCAANRGKPGRAIANDHAVIWRIRISTSSRFFSLVSVTPWKRFAPVKSPFTLP